MSGQSFHDCKGIAGNIIPAIATTNAVIAGLQVLEAIKILRADRPVKEVCKYTYCLRNPTRKGLYLQPVKLADPSPSCFVCGVSQVSKPPKHSVLFRFVEKGCHLTFSLPPVLPRHS